MSSLIAGLRPMNTWRMNGSLDFAVSPSELLFVGSVRQPSTRLTFRLNDVLEDLGEAAAPGRVARQEHEAARVFAGARQ